MQVSEATPTSSIARAPDDLPPAPAAITFPCRQPRGRRSVAVAIGLALLAFSGSACGDDNEPEVAAATVPVGASDTSPPSDTAAPDPEVSLDTAVGLSRDEEEVLAAVECYWETLIAASSPPDPDHPGFGRCFTGRALELAVATVSERLELGQTVSDPDGALPRSILIVEFTSDRAVVQTCILDDGLLIDASSGHVIDDGVATIRSELTLALIDEGDWRVERAVIVEERPGEQPC